MPKLDDPLCQKHQPKDPRACIHMVSQQFMPAVRISLAELRSNVVRLLQEHNNLLSVVSFTRCYEETFGPLNKAEPASEKEHDGDNEKSNKDSMFMSNYVPLEHLITCVSNVSIQLTVNGIKVVTLSQDSSQDATIVPTTADAPTQGLATAENLRQFRREVVDLVKQQVGCALPLNKFIPAYHAHFGKQCRVSDYGFARLQDLIEALNGIVHIVGDGPLRTIMLTHVIQVRRFTHDILRLLKGEQKKYIPISKLPHIYGEVFHKPFLPSNYGVCSLLDLLNDVAESKLVVENVEEEGPCVVIPRRVQTAEQKVRTQLFGVEVVDMLSTMQRFQIAFTKFIPAYHHAFNHQCRVAEYGFAKFIELLEALPHVVEVMHLPSSIAFKAYLILLPEDYGFDTLEEMFASFSEVFLTQQQPQRHLGASTPESTKSTSHNPILTMVDDYPKKETTKFNDERAPSTTIYVCLVDKYKIKQATYRCLQILFNSPFGSIPEDEFKEHYRVTFQEEIDLDYVHEEMSPFISVKNYSVQMQNPVGAGTKPTAADLDETEATVIGSRMVQLCPLILFARQLRFLLVRTRGRLMLNLLEQMYQRHFGIALCPEAYGYPSILTLIHAIDFVVAVRGRGARAILFLAQDYLGKLAWKIAYKIPFRHDLINRYNTDEVTSKESPHSGVLEEYHSPTNEMYRPTQRQTATVPWHYPSCMTQEGQFMQTTMGPTKFLPINAFPVDAQQPIECPLTVSGFFLPSPITQGYALSQVQSIPEWTIYDYQGQIQELPYVPNNSLLAYPGVPPTTELPKLTPTYVSFNIANGETPLQAIPLSVGPVWGQTTEQQSTPAPFYAFPMKPSFTPLLQGVLGYGYTATNIVNPAPPMPNETEGSPLAANQSSVPTMPTSVSQEEYIPETTVNEQQDPREALTPENDGTHPNLNDTSANYHTISLPSLTGWLPQTAQQVWTPSLIYQNSQAPLGNHAVDGQVVTPQGGAWITDCNQWLSSCRIATQWPVLQATPIDVQLPSQVTIPTVDPQSVNDGTVVLNGHLSVDNSVILKPVQCQSDIGPDVNQSVNKCEEGDWTLPISMTTESIDMNSKENDETGSIE
ncbi:unnamed protein product [Hydatigera taeniaeformis]|uniref:HTH OST-type domain-containing protein n=1 Tax=Hydatigena taeniaeformis TaxID=6205 RepID=A0A3P7FWL9_HYDTA|nr:unnamed protein product [Hydatigera taeniaeformis]